MYSLCKILWLVQRFCSNYISFPCYYVQMTSRKLFESISLHIHPCLVQERFPNPFPIRVRHHFSLHILLDKLHINNLIVRIRYYEHKYIMICYRKTTVNMFKPSGRRPNYLNRNTPRLFTFRK